LGHVDVGDGSLAALHAVDALFETAYLSLDNGEGRHFVGSLPDGVFLTTSEDVVFHGAVLLEAVFEVTQSWHGYGLTKWIEQKCAKDAKGDAGFVDRVETPEELPLPVSPVTSKGV
jgi:hypothetical protein